MTKLLRFSFAFLIFSSSLLPAETKSLEDWWKGKGAAGELFGIRPTLEDRGLDFSGHWCERVCQRGYGRAGKARRFR